MPGFFIVTGEKDSQPNTIETLRQHRWRIAQLGMIKTPADLYLAKELQLPNFSVNQDTVEGASLEYKYAKNISWEDVTISFYDTVGLLFLLKDWRDKVWTPEDGLKDAGSYKDECIFHMQDGLGTDLITVKLINAWPKKIAHGPLSYTSSEIKYLQITLAYDWAVETRSNQ